MHIYVFRAEQNLFQGKQVFLDITGYAIQGNKAMMYCVHNVIEMNECVVSKRILYDQEKSFYK